MDETFTDRVIDVVSEIPVGKTMSYKEVAKKAGNEKAARAVGNILNRYYEDCLITGKKRIPCHRVIRSDGGLGGYVKGEDEKRQLLERENAI
jgi:O-6-methylguanine DNA methyltransferase